MSSNPTMRTFTGLATARGLASGPVFLYRGEGPIVIPEDLVEPGKEEAEVDRLARARAKARLEIEQLIAVLRERTNHEDVRVFECHLLILEDPLLTEGAARYIRQERLNAAAATRRISDDLRRQFAHMNDTYFRERIRDLDDVERRLMTVLLGTGDASPLDIKVPSVIVAHDLTPSESVRIPRELVLGIATDGGSTTCHAAVLARALGIPAVSGLGDITAKVSSGEWVLLDGTTGTITVAPDVAARTEFARLESLQRESRAILRAGAPVGTLADGGHVFLCANVQPGIPISGVRESGASGIGLYRSEYLWLGREREPTEDEQFEAYREVAQFAATLGPEATVTIRVLDIGGDKIMRGLSAPEANPFLGHRSIRYLLSNPEVFRTQLRAILRASAFGPVCLLYPMISCVEELTKAATILADVKRELSEKGVAYAHDIPVGTMIEVPSAAINAEAMARHVDFFSIGTNDLVQYTMAADRANDAVVHLYQPTHPAVLWLVRHTIEAAKRAGVRVSVCGESAADPVVGVLWAAMGVDMLSMSPSLLPGVSAVLRRLTRADMTAYATFVSSLDVGLTAAKVYEAAHGWLKDHIPDFDLLSL